MTSLSFPLLVKSGPTPGHLQDLQNYGASIELCLEEERAGNFRDALESLFLGQLRRFGIFQYNITIRHLFFNGREPSVTWSIDGNLDVIRQYVRKPFAFLGSTILKQSIVQDHEAAIFWGDTPDVAERRTLPREELAFEDFFAEHRYFYGASLTIPDLVQPSPWRITVGLRARETSRRDRWEAYFRTNEWYIYEIVRDYCHRLLRMPRFVEGMHFRHPAQRAVAAAAREPLLANLHRLEHHNPSHRLAIRSADNVHYLGHWQAAAAATPSPDPRPMPVERRPARPDPVRQIVDDLRMRIRDRMPHFADLDRLAGLVSLSLSMGLDKALAASTPSGGQPSPSGLPACAPALYCDRADRRQTIVDFLRATWMPWIQAGMLTRPALNRLDPQAYVAMANWLRRNEWPTDLTIPTKSDMVTADLADPDRLREARRLLRAHHTRRR